MKKIITDNIFGQTIRNMRRRKGLSQDQVVLQLQLLGSPIVRGTYSLIESGRGNIFMSDLVGLKQIFDVEYSEFFEGIDTMR